MTVLRASACSFLALIVLAASPAFAQTAPPADPAHPGVRAAGMGGAFTAVADDASGVYWNPAGLPGSFFSLVIDYTTSDMTSGTLIGMSTPPLGLSYYRTATGDAANGRNSLVAHHAGVTLVQSLADRLTIGGTVKAVHGIVESGAGPAVSSTKFDADLGVMASGSLGRLGLTVHNLFEPDFDGPTAPVTLERRVRAGISLNTGRLSTVATDVDLSGEVREAAVGTEIASAHEGVVAGRRALEVPRRRRGAGRQRRRKLRGLRVDSGGRPGEFRPRRPRLGGRIALRVLGSPLLFLTKNVNHIGYPSPRARFITRCQSA